MKTLRSLFLSAAVAATCARAYAQPALDRILASARVREGNKCAVVTIAFNGPVRYLSHFPVDEGDQLSIRLGPISASSGMSLGRESIKPPSDAGITDIEYDGAAAGGPVLSVQFSHTTRFAVEQGGDFRSLVVTVGATGAQACTTENAPAEPPQKTPEPGVPSSARAMNLAPESIEARKSLDDARAAITAGRYADAIGLLSKLLQEPESGATPEAQELLGVAREKNGQLAHAKAEYETYLKRYPNGEGAERVRQRLSSLLNRALKPSGTVVGDAGEPMATQWSFTGSASEYYFHDELRTVIHDDNTQIVIDNGLTTLQSELVSAFDGSLMLDAGDYQGAIRASLAYTKNFVDTRFSRLSVAALYLEAASEGRDYLVRLGRQYRNTGGVYGRIDGVLASARINDEFKVELVGGYPIDSSWSKPQNHRQAYGGSLVFSSGGWGGDLYFIRQTDEGLVDRQAIGMEGHYVGKSMSVFSTFDYDIHFGEVNIALLNANFILADQTAINLAADYRRAPLLRTSDALIGQSVPTLAALLSTYTPGEIQQLALDRTARSTSFFASVNHPIAEKYSIGLDATLWNMTGSPASGGVAAIPSVGLETYFSGHLSGSGLLTEGDLGMFNIGYASTYHANRYTLDLNTRYPVTPSFRIGPRLFVGYRRATDTDATQLSLRPTLRMNYHIDNKAELELEAGAEYQKNHLLGTTTTLWNFLLTAGIRVDF